MNAAFQVACLFDTLFQVFQLTTEIPVGDTDGNAALRRRAGHHLVQLVTWRCCIVEFGHDGCSVEVLTWASMPNAARMAIGT